jgi:peptide methionine sulfoxide reductase MsrA
VKSESAIFAGGCFWCTEAIFQSIDGVISVESGYIGGHVATAAEQGIARTEAEIGKPLVTTLEPLSEWYPAEDYHQNFWEKEGQENAFCMMNIPAKLQKLRNKFPQQAKENPI